MERSKELSEILDMLEERISKKVTTNILLKLPVKQGFSVSEFSELTGFDSQTIINYCNDGLLEATQIKKGGNWFIKASELERLINEAVSNRFNEFKRPTKRENILLKHLGFSVNKPKSNT